MTAFAFILGVVPLLTASGRRRRVAQGDRHGRLRRHAHRDHPRRLPGPGAVRRRSRRSSAAGKPAPAPATPPRRSPPITGRGALTCATARSRRSASSRRAISVCAGRLRRRPELRAARNCRRRLQYRFVEAPAQVASRWPTRRWFAGVRRPGAAGAHPATPSPTTSTSAVARGARRGGARERGHREVVPVPRRSTARGAYGVRGASTTGRTSTTPTHPERNATAFSCRGRSTCSAGCGADRKRPSPWLLASEQGRRGVLVTLVGDVASNYFLLRELDLQLEIARRDAAPQRRDRRVFPEPARRRRVRIASSSIGAQATARSDRRRHPGNRAADRARRERRSRCSSGVRRARSPASAADHRRSAAAADSGRACPRRCSSAGPTSSQAEQLLVAANADIGVAKSLFYPTISLTGFLGGVSGDLTIVPRRDRRRVVAGRRALPADLPGRADPAEPTRRRRRRFDAALAAVPEGRAQRLPRGRQLARHDSEAGRAARSIGNWASSRCRMPPIWPVRATIPASPATSRS